jgi:hypothetical protein
MKPPTKPAATKIVMYWLVATEVGRRRRDQKRDCRERYASGEHVIDPRPNAEDLADHGDGNRREGRESGRNCACEQDHSEERRTAMMQCGLVRSGGAKLVPYPQGT